MSSHLLWHWLLFWAMLRNTSWGAWLAAVGLVVGLGAFLDEYYVGEGIRASVRQRLIRCLERLAYPRAVLGFFVSEMKRTAVLALIALVPGALCVAIFTLWRGGHHAIAIAIVVLLVVLALPAFIVFAIPLFPAGLLFLGKLLFLAAVFTFLLIRSLISLVFRPAAEPKRSPFKFATGMVGLWILAAKFILELSK